MFRSFTALTPNPPTPTMDANPRASTAADCLCPCACPDLARAPLACVCCLHPRFSLAGAAAAQETGNIIGRPIIRETSSRPFNHAGRATLSTSSAGAASGKRALEPFREAWQRTGLLFSGFRLDPGDAARSARIGIKVAVVVRRLAPAILRSLLHSIAARDGSASLSGKSGTRSSGRHLI